MSRQGVSILDALEEFYAEQEYKGNRPATLLYYRKNFEHFLKDTGVVDLGEFEEGVIRRWLLAHRTLSPNSLATYDRCLRVFAGWLYRRGYVPDSPMGKLPKPKGKRVEIITFTEVEVRAMLADAQRRNHPLRDSALLTLLLDTGLRIGEATSLRLHDVDWGLCSMVSHSPAHL
jgi:integrase/recombinase XerD